MSANYSPNSFLRCAMSDQVMSDCSYLVPPPAATPVSPSGVSILLVEDDVIIREVVSTTLSAHGYRVVEAGNIETALRALKLQSFALVIVDIGLPDGSGHDLVSALTSDTGPAVIFMTSLSAADDRIRGLNAGDDYVVKPVDPYELVARVGAVLRRYLRASSSNTVLEFGGWTMDLVRRELADPDGKIIALTRGEFDLLAALVHARGQPLSRDFLIEVVASVHSDAKERSIDVLVSRARRKLATSQARAPRILTTRRAGYRFEPPS